MKGLILAYYTAPKVGVLNGTHDPKIFIKQMLMSGASNKVHCKMYHSNGYRLLQEFVAQFALNKIK